MIHVYLVRHGESYSNVEHRHCGRPPGPGLTPRGRQQAAAAAVLLAQRSPAPVAVVSSPLLRAIETAQAFAELRRMPVRIDARLREVDFGDWEGLDDKTLKAVPGYPQYHRDPEGNPPPGGERLSDIRERMVRCLDGLVHAPGATSLACFTHYDPMVAFYLHVVGGAYGVATELSLSNAVIVGFVWDCGRWRFDGVDRRAALADADEHLKAAF